MRNGQPRSVMVVLWRMLIRDTILRYVTAVVLEISYGRKVVFDDDRFLKNAEILDELIAAVGATGLNILDFLPICKQRLHPDLNNLISRFWLKVKYIPPWVPGAWFSKFAHSELSDPYSPTIL